MAVLTKAHPLTPAFYQELLALEGVLPIEPYGAIISTPPPSTSASVKTEAPSEGAEVEEAMLPRHKNTDPQFTNKPYTYVFFGFTLAFAGVYLYFPVRSRSH